MNVCDIALFNHKDELIMVSSYFCKTKGPQKPLTHNPDRAKTCPLEKCHSGL